MTELFFFNQNFLKFVKFHFLFCYIESRMIRAFKQVQTSLVLVKWFLKDSLWNLENILTFPLFNTWNQSIYKWGGREGERWRIWWNLKLFFFFEKRGNLFILQFWRGTWNFVQRKQKIWGRDATQPVQNLGECNFFGQTFPFPLWC